MTINVNISAENPAEYFATLKSLLAGAGGSPVPPVTSEPQPEQPAKPKVDKPKAESKKSEPLAAATATVATASEKSYTLADIADIVPKCAAKDRSRTVELLGKFGAKKGGELKVSDYAAFIADANAFLAE